MQNCGVQIGGLRPLFDGAVAKHQMRKIEIEFMRRDIGTLRHETHVAQRARIYDRLETAAVDGIEFAAFRVVDQVEQPRKGIAQIEAPAAAQTIENDGSPESIFMATMAQNGCEMAEPDARTLMPAAGLRMDQAFRIADALVAAGGVSGPS